jgi:hypothetical protein
MEKQTTETGSMEGGRLDCKVMDLERWELYRIEMAVHKERLSKLAVSFMELGAFGDAATCAIKAEGLSYAIARMPKFEP